MDRFTYLVAAAGMLMFGIWVALAAYRHGRAHRTAVATRRREDARVVRDLEAWERRMLAARMAERAHRVDPVALQQSMDMPDHLVHPEDRS